MKLNQSTGTAKAITLVALSLLVALLALPGTTSAQSITGSISGSVVDESGGVIPGADVTVINEASKGVRRSVTNADGFFAFASLPAATYTVQVSIAGFNTYEVTGIELRSGDSRSLRQIALKVATVAETVSVSAEVALTPLNSGEKSATLTSEQIENIPIIGTSAAEVLRLLPGMTPSTNGTSNKPNFSGEIYGINGNGEGGQQSAVGNYSANGNRTWALDITIDGAPGADPGCNCATSVNPNTEFVQEFKVLQSNFSAEHAKGPVAMSVISKSGGRDFHGSVFGYLRRLQAQLERVVREQGRRGAGQEQVQLPRLHPQRPAAHPGHGLQQEPRQGLLLRRVRVLRPGPRHRLRQVVGPDRREQRAGNFNNSAAVGSGSFVNTAINLPGGIVPASQIDPGGQALLNMFQQPNANPAQTGGYNYVDNILLEPERLAGPRAPRLQHLRQHEAVPALQHPARDAALRDRPVVEERRAPAPVPVPDQRGEPLRLGLGQPDARVRPDADERDDPRLHLHQLPERDRRQGGDLAPGPRLSVPGRLRRQQRPDPVRRPGRLGAPTAR